MPKWMSRLIRTADRADGLIFDTGGNDIEELLSSRPALVQVNAPRALIQVAVRAQIGLLMRMEAAGLINHAAPVLAKKMVSDAAD